MTYFFAALFLLNALLLWAVVRTRGWWVPKALAIVVVLGFNLLAFHAGPSFTGWPATVGIPDESQLVSCYVREPDAVYLWVVPLKAPSKYGYRYITGEPRSYRLDYTRELHAECQAAQKALAKGIAIGVLGLGHVPPRGGLGGKRVFYKLPPSLPKKGGSP